MATIAVSSGTTADELQNIIDQAGADNDFVLEAGTYEFDQTIFIRHDNVTITGAGTGATLINVGAAIGNAPLFQFGHSLHHPDIVSRIELAAPATIGSTTIQVQDGHGLEVGSYVYLSQDNTDDFLDSIGDWSWRKTKDLRTQLVEVTGVDGNEISIEAPLTFDYDPAITQVQVRNILTGVGISGITITGPYGSSDPSDFSNTESSGLGQTMIMLGGVRNAFVHNVEIIDGISHGITIAGSREVTVRDFLMDGTHNKGASGNGYALWIRDVYESVFEDLSIVDVRHAVLFASYTSASGNDVHVSYTNRDINFHGGLDQFNTVVVDAMIRNPEEQTYLSNAVSFNSGSSWGAPTDPSTNSVMFRQLVGTNKDEFVVSHFEGSVISTVAGDDTIQTGAGDDIVDAGSGRDMIIASGGQDEYDGGFGTDIVVFSGNVDDYQISEFAEVLVIENNNGRATLRNVEIVQFNDAVLDIDTGTAVLFQPPEPEEPEPQGAPPDLAFIATWLDDIIIEAGDTTRVRLEVTNQGGTAAEGHSDFFWSEDAVFDAGDIWIDQDRHGTLKVGEIDTNEREKLDDDLLAELGSGYIFAVLDHHNTIQEIDETNNVSQAMYLEII